MSETFIENDIAVKNTITHQLSLSLNANLIESNNWLIANDYGSVIEEYKAFKEKPVLVDFSDNGVVRISGADSKDFLHKMSANDIYNLKENHIITSSLTNADGRFIDVITVLAENDGLTLIGSEGNGKSIAEWLTKYHFSEDLEISDQSGQYGLFALYGKDPAKLISDFECTILHSDNKSVFLLLKDEPADIWQALLESGVTPAGRESWNIRRVEWGIPRFGYEIGSNANPLEAGLANSVSFTKGCYIGQEVIARMDTYDKVSRQLRRVHLSEQIDFTEKINLMSESKIVGELTSSVYSFELGKHIGLGYIKKKIAEIGKELSVSNSDAIAIVGEDFSEPKYSESVR